MATGMKHRTDRRNGRTARRTRALAGCLAVLAYLVWSGTAVAASPIQSGLPEPLSSTEIVEQAKSLDGLPVVYEGEIIGDIMKRGDHVWINVFDGKSALGAWILEENLPPLAVAGSYWQMGDIVRIVGTFNKACPEHGGDYDLHASQLFQIEPGIRVEHPLNPWLAIAAIALFGLAALVLLLYQRQRITRAKLVRHWTKGDSQHRLP